MFSALVWNTTTYFLCRSLQPRLMKSGLTLTCLGISPYKVCNFYLYVWNQSGFTLSQCVEFLYRNLIFFPLYQIRILPLNSQRTRMDTKMLFWSRYTFHFHQSLKSLSVLVCDTCRQSSLLRDFSLPNQRLCGSRLFLWRMLEQFMCQRLRKQRQGLWCHQRISGRKNHRVVFNSGALL